MKYIDINITDGGYPVRVERLNVPIFTGDSGNLCFRIVGDDEFMNPTFSVYAIRADGSTVVDNITRGIDRQYKLLVGGSLTAVPGRMQLVFKAKDTLKNVYTIAAYDCVVVNTTTDTIVDPSRVVPSLDELLVQIATIEAATTAANAAAAKVSNMTVRATPSDHFDVQASTNPQGGIDINILGGVGVKGDKGEKGDPGGIVSVCGVQADDEGNVQLTYGGIPKAPQIRVGRITTGSVPKNSYVDVTGFTFDTPFSSGSTVVVLLNPELGGNSILGGVNLSVRNVTENGFNVRLCNSTDTNVGSAINATYIAIGYTA